MAQDVVCLLFPGDAAQLRPRYARGVQSWRASGGAEPESVVVADSDGGLLVTLVWPVDVDHHHFGAHMLSNLDALSLPLPTVQHGRLATSSWTALADSASASSA